MVKYNQKAIAFIFNLKKPINEDAIKRELVTFIYDTEIDDKLYIYTEFGLCFDKKSEIIATLAAYNCNLPFQVLVRDAICALNYECFSFGEHSKTICVLSDKQIDNYQINKMFNLAKKEECKVFVFETTSIFPDSVKLTDFDDLSSILIKLYKEEM
jgi:hypothetical protein